MSLWDPRSYLAEAASRQILTTDTTTSATTIVNYYDSIASHLATASKTASILEQAQSDVRQCCGCIPEDPTDPTEGVVAGLAGGSLQGVRMHVPYRILYSVALSSELADDAARAFSQRIAGCISEAVDRAFERCVAHFSLEEGSEMKRISDSLPAGEPMEVSTEMAQVLRFAKWLHALTDGSYDPTMGDIAEIFKMALDRHGSRPGETSHWATFDDPSKPTKSRNKDMQMAYYDAAEVAGFDNIELIPPSTCGSSKWCVQKRHTSTRLDLCALTKGWTVDLIAGEIVRSISGLDSLNSPRISGFLVDWGGDIASWGSVSQNGAAGDTAASKALSRPWRVAIEQPPKLKLLFDAWKDKSRFAERSFLHLVHIPPPDDFDGRFRNSAQQAFTAVATSGDYHQLQRFGYYHLVDAHTKVPLKVSNHAVSSATVIAHSCMFADGISTALMLMREMTKCVDLIARIREHSANAGLEQYGSVWRYYLYERNHANFVHDEDDEFVGQGDEVRRQASDKKAAQHFAYDQVESVTTGSSARAAAAPESTSRTGSATLVEQLKHLMRNQASEVVVATIPAGHGVSSPPPTSATERGAERHLSQQGLHAVILSSVVTLPSSAHDGAASTTSAIDGHSACRVVFFNVMRGSVLHNFVASVGNLVTLHFLRNRAEDIAIADEMQRRGMGSWICDHGRVADLVDLAPPGEVARCAVTSNALVHVAEVVRIVFVTAMGDHLLVVAKGVVPRESWPDSSSEPPHVLGGYDLSELQLPQWNCRLKNVPPTLWTPGVAIAPHSEFGRIGFPFLGLRMCSVDPPLLSFVALCSVATHGVVTAKIPGRNLTLHLFSSPPTDGVDPFAHGHSGSVSAASFHRYKLLPFAVYSTPPSAASVKCVIVRTMTVRSAREKEGVVVVDDRYDSDAGWDDDASEDCVLVVAAVTSVLSTNAVDRGLLGLLGGTVLKK